MKKTASIPSLLRTKCLACGLGAFLRPNTWHRCGDCEVNGVITWLLVSA